MCYYVTAYLKWCRRIASSNISSLSQLLSPTLKAARSATKNWVELATSNLRLHLERNAKHGCFFVGFRMGKKRCLNDCEKLIGKSWAKFTRSGEWGSEWWGGGSAIHLETRCLIKDSRPAADFLQPTTCKSSFLLVSCPTTLQCIYFNIQRTEKYSVAMC